MNIEIFVTCFLLFGGHFKKIKKKSDGVGIFEINWVSFDDYALPLTQ
jgi:plasmid replication initiation protein